MLMLVMRLIVGLGSIGMAVVVAQNAPRTADPFLFWLLLSGFILAGAAIIIEAVRRCIKAIQHCIEAIRR